MTMTDHTRPAGAVRLPAVRLDGVTKAFGSVHALRGIDLELNQGEIVAFLGPERRLR